MCDALQSRAKAVLCIGKTGSAVAAKVKKALPCGDLETAMSKAKALASPGDVVLLSTGFASYDQFANFEQRGLRFAELARQSRAFSSDM
jgi:UDP-N-acetylmuramoylalanine--D-glutamate ligase